MSGNKVFNVVDNIAKNCGWRKEINGLAVCSLITAPGSSPLCLRTIEAGKCAVLNKKTGPKKK